MGRLDNEGFSHVIINGDIIELTIKGRQTRQTVRSTSEQINKEIKDLKARGKKIQIMADISGMSATDSTSGSRQEARKMLANLSVDRAAVYGKGVWMGFIMYLTKVTGTGGKIRFFTNKRKAHSWLKLETQPGNKLRSQVGLVDLSALTTGGKYLVSVPKDPQCGTGSVCNANGTGYRIAKDTNGRLIVNAPAAEQSKTISVTK